MSVTRTIVVLCGLSLAAEVDSRVLLLILLVVEEEVVLDESTCTADEVVPSVSVDCAAVLEGFEGVTWRFVETCEDPPSFPRHTQILTSSSICKLTDALIARFRGLRSQDRKEKISRRNPQYTA